MSPQVMDEERAASESGADSGCTLCARALVNAGDACVDFAVAEAPPAPPAARLRESILRSARGRRAPVPPRALPAPPPSRYPPDPSASVGRLHIGGRGDAERTVEIDALGALEPHEDETTPRLFAQLERLIRFPVLFVSIVRGERVGYRVQRGLDPKLAESRQIRREMSYCTHTVDTGAPFIVQNAGAEAFFRGSRMVRRLDFNVYAGVPLCTSRGVTIGTLCALDYAARPVSSEVIRMLELFTRPVLAEIERSRRVPFSDEPGVHPLGWFHELLSIELAQSRLRAQPSALIAVPGPASSVVALAQEDESLGRLDASTVGLLLPGVDPTAAEARASAIRANLTAQGLPSGGVRLALTSVNLPDATTWVSSATSASSAQLPAL